VFVHAGVAVVRPLGWRKPETGRWGMINTMPGTDYQRNNGGGHYARLFGVGFTFILTLGVPAVVGFFVDRLLGTLPLFLLVGLGIGFAGGLYYVYQALKKLGDG
jgi:ATP synthase protein I